MVEIEMIVNPLMAALAAGGKDVAKEMAKGSINWAKNSIVKLGQTMLLDNPKAYALADEVAAQPENKELVTELRAALNQILAKMDQDQIRQAVAGDVNVSIDEVKADNGSIAIGVNFGNGGTINN